MREWIEIGKIRERMRERLRERWRERLRENARKNERERNKIFILPSPMKEKFNSFKKKNKGSVKIRPLMKRKEGSKEGRTGREEGKNFLLELSYFHQHCIFLELPFGYFVYEILDTCRG